MASAASVVVKQATPQGFEVTETVELAVSAANAYAALGRIGS